MKADEAADMMDQEHSADRFKQRAAVVIAFFAMLLAITGLGGGNAAKEAVNSNIAASNLYSFYQAKNVRQTAIMLAADQIELAVAQRSGAAGCGQGGAARQARAISRDGRSATNPSPRPARARRSCSSARRCRRSRATTRCARIPISTMAKRCCRSPSC